MADDIIPAWGFPWHGLIRDSKLTLANGQQIPMRQPVNGDTSLIDFGAPTPVGDETDGKRWLNKAILTGDTVHGKFIGASSWLYKAPDSSVWRVDYSGYGYTDVGGQATFKLSRFGEFGAPSESYSYSVPLPTQYMMSYYNDIVMRKYDVRPNGSAALFCLIKPDVNSQPLSWFEFKLSGPADSCVITAECRYTLEQAEGDITLTNTLDSKLAPAYGVDGTESDSLDYSEENWGGTYTFIGTPVQRQGTSGRLWMSSGSRTVSIIGKVVAIFYSATGDIVEMLADIKTREDKSSSGQSLSGISSLFSYAHVKPLPNKQVLGVRQLKCTLTVTNTTNETGSLEIRLSTGGTVVKKTLSRVTAETLTNRIIGGYGYGVAGLDVPPLPEQPTDELIISEYSTCTPGGSGDGALLPAQRTISEMINAPGIFGGWWFAEDGSLTTISYDFINLSNTVHAIRERVPKSGSTLYEIGPVFYGRGQPVAKTKISTSGTYFPRASHNPITGEIAVDNEKNVSWT